MKKFKILALLLVAVLCASMLVACKPFKPDWEDNGNTLWIGNTAATTGAFAAVGVPFNIALEAYLAYYNTEVRKTGDREVKFKHYDDGFTAENGVAYTEKLVEEDKIFALVGHFGTNTVGATLNYIKEKRVPMVYAATGIADLFYANAKGTERYILPVQPIFTTEGAIFMLRATAKDPAIGLGLTKIGVIYTNDDAGLAMKSEIDKQAAQIKKQTGYSGVTVTAQQVGASTAAADSPAAVAALKNAGVQCVIVAANQAPSTAIIKAMEAGALDVPVLTSYVNASVTFVAGLGTAVSGNRLIYTNAWVDSITLVEDVAEFMRIMKTYAVLGSSGFTLAEEYSASDTLDIRNNSYAMAGYIAAATFIQGLVRTIENTNGNITQAAFIDAMESAPIAIPMGGKLDFSNGSRRGVERLSFYAFGAGGAVDFTTFRLFKTPAEMMESLNG